MRRSVETNRMAGLLQGKQRLGGSMAEVTKGESIE